MYLVVRRVGVLRARPRPTAAPAVFLCYRRLRVEGAVVDEDAIRRARRGIQHRFDRGDLEPALAVAGAHGARLVGRPGFA